MLERRAARRRRVCFEGAVASGLTGPVAAVRVRNLSAGGAEIVVPGAGLASADIELAVERADLSRQARVVWRRMDRFGVEFVAARPPAVGNDAPAPSRPDLFAEFLARRRA